MVTAEFFSKEWADAVRDALTAGPDEQARAVKLQEYWDFFDFLKSVYPASWALGCRDLGVVPVRAVGRRHGDRLPDHRAGRPPPTSPGLFKATYVLGMDYRDWKALHDGYDAQRTVMYRKILLEQGDLLEFFKAIYFFVESLSVIGAVPAAYAWVTGRGPAAGRRSARPARPARPAPTGWCRRSGRPARGCCTATPRSRTSG